MAVLPGQQAPLDLDLGQVRNPNGTVNLEDRTLPRWTHTQATTDAHLPALGPLTDNSPIPGFPAEVVSGERAPSFYDDFYNRIYFYPRAVEFGAITQTTTTGLTVWNAYLHPTTLSQVTEENGEGISLSGPPVPLELGPLATTYYEVVAEEEGPPTINAAFFFDFGSEGTHHLEVTGARARLWPFPPNWRRPYQIRYEYKTEILTSHSGKEQRRALRQQPRKTLEHSVALMNAAELRQYKRLMATWQHRSWIFPERTRRGVVTVGMPANGNTLTFAATPSWVRPGATVVLDHLGVAELRTVDSVDATTVIFSGSTATVWPAGTYVYPGLAGFLDTQLNAPRKTNTVAEVAVSFDVDPGSEPPPEPPDAERTLRGREVFLRRPNWAEAVNSSNEFPAELVDFGFGRVGRFTPVEFGTTTREATYLNQSPEEADALLDTFLRARGQWGEFYAPTWEHDMVAAQALSQGAATFRAVGTDLYDAFSGDSVHAGMSILLTDGTVLTRRVLGLALASDALGEDTLVSVDEPWAASVPLNSIVMASWMPVWRMASDGFTMEWLTNTVAQTKIAMRTLEDLPEETPP